ncbi:hypothetical protein QJS10_CPA07g00486 [Acorus calamus]|uniref:Reverse transcriptase n=1 Tax=Acorus calamus TaxID=4465 RepID=A0AAV9EF75_ACOCL|nr:hypothetical protein QJS10_CPA07g00486 [Acorus calamus]
MIQVFVTPDIPSGPRPFKYMQAWESHSDFERIVSSAWNCPFVGSPLYVLVKKLQNLKGILKSWNRDYFGNIQDELAFSWRKLDRIQVTSLLDPLNDELILQERLAKLEYLEVLKREEAHLRQKSRQLWLKEGDSNSKFFYSSMKARAAYNSIRKVKLANGSFSSDPVVIKSYAVQYFQSILNQPSIEPLLILHSPIQLNDEDIAALTKHVSDAEIKSALFTTNPLLMASRLGSFNFSGI